MVDLIPGMGSVDWFSSLTKVMYYAGIFFLAVIILAVFAAVLYVMKFRIKATIFPMFGSGKDGVFTFGKPKKNRIKWVNNKTAWKSLMPLFNKKEREPFDTEYIYPGNHAYVYELNDEWVPGRRNVNVELKDLEGEEKEKIEKEVCDWLKEKYPTKTKWVPVRINVNQTEEKIRAEINPVPYYVRNWQSLQYRKHELEFAKQDFWTENKQLLITLGVCAFNCILCGAVIYFTFQFAGGQGNKIDVMTKAIESIGTIAGNAPR